MSHGYGSLRGITGVWFVVVGILLLIVLAPIASVAADSPTAQSPTNGSEVIIAATIRPVRIVVVDNHDKIIEILSNGPSAVAPDFHRGSPDGPAANITPFMSKQYATIMRRLDQNKTGVIYHRQANRKSSLLNNPTVISILLTGTHLAI